MNLLTDQELLDGFDKFSGTIKDVEVIGEAFERAFGWDQAEQSCSWALGSSEELKSVPFRCGQRVTKHQEIYRLSCRRSLFWGECYNPVSGVPQHIGAGTQQ